MGVVTAVLVGLGLLFAASFLIRAPSKSRGRVTIRRPPVELWSFITDPRHIPLWNPGVVDVELDSPLPLRPGSGYRYTVVAGRRRIPCRATVELAEAPSAIRTRVLIGFIESEATYRLESVAGGTVLHATTESRVPLLQAMAWTVLGRRWFGAGLERLRVVAELETG